MNIVEQNSIESFIEKLVTEKILNPRIINKLKTTKKFVHAQNMVNHFLKLKRKLKKYESKCSTNSVEPSINIQWAYNNIDLVNVNELKEKIYSLMRADESNMNGKLLKKKKKKKRKKIKGSSFEDNWLSHNSVHHVKYIGHMYNQ